MDHLIFFVPKYEELFLKDASFEKLSTGLSFSEGPVWDIAKNCLYFTDFANDIIYKWTKKEGSVPYRTAANRPIGLSLSYDGRIISTESSAHRIAYADEKKSERIAGFYQGKWFNSPNDVVAKSDGSIWFTDPYSTAMGAKKELDMDGVYRISQTGEVTLVTGELGRPNGLAFTPDESSLYVNDTNLQQIFKIDLFEDGSFGELRLFVTLDPSYGDGAPDGMKVDVAGNVWVTGPGGLWVITPDGIPAAVLRTPEFAGNFCFGGPDNRVLFIAACSSLYAYPVAISGIIPKQKGNDHG
ncbi:MAG TPA: gluconolactonase [Lachnoclostridium sp.]|uniref:SMP-30/gluconolactonase/LRE family protein n=1 Tax=Lacrimispora sp. TaxID=2719234 RepID=UPI000ED0500E|nr:SMP-30/gluconolactonase/LRE family protein [Lacrimispora sp.]HCD46423.1 gluconolactonase [Lachnoclostridium sp.]